MRKLVLLIEGKPAASSFKKKITFSIIQRELAHSESGTGET